MEQSTSLLFTENVLRKFVNNFSFASSLGTVLVTGRNGIKNTAQKHGMSAMPKK